MNVSIALTYLLQVFSKFQEAYNPKLFQIQSPKSGKEIISTTH